MIQKPYDYTVIAYASKNYKRFLKRLKESLEDLKIPNKLVQYDQWTDHRGTSLYRPTFIRDTINELKSTVLYVDVDSVFIKKPKLPKLDFDIGTTKRVNEDGIYKPRKYIKNWNFASVFRYTDATIHFLEVYKYLCDWRDLKNVSDHIRVNWVKWMLEGEFKEIFMNKYFSNCIIGYIDHGKKSVKIGVEKDGKS